MMTTMEAGDHGTRGCSTNSYRATVSTQSFVTGNRSNDQGEANRLDYAANNIIGCDSVTNGSQKLTHRETEETRRHHTRHRRCPQRRQLP